MGMLAALNCLQCLVSSILHRCLGIQISLEQLSVNVQAITRQTSFSTGGFHEEVKGIGDGGLYLLKTVISHYRVAEAVIVGVNLCNVPGGCLVTPDKASSPPLQPLVTSL